MDEERALYEGYRALAGNIFWTWLTGELERRREYALGRLRRAEDWADYRGIIGELNALELVRQLCEEAAEPYLPQKEEE